MASSVTKPVLLAVGKFHVTPPPMKKPFLAWNVSPSVAAVKLETFEVVGARLPSIPMIGVFTVSVLLNGFSPLSSPVILRGACDGKPTPAPQRNPFDSVTSAGDPLSAAPP